NPGMYRQLTRRRDQGEPPCGPLHLPVSIGGNYICSKSTVTKSSTIFFDLRKKTFFLQNIITTILNAALDINQDRSIKSFRTML
ncbi:MAG: hypothetical protein MUP61_03050, partial [Burkholderiales bacterium]|nr:hypothetical protein [Burkholderiales bacterium]